MLQLLIKIGNNRNVHIIRDGDGSFGSVSLYEAVKPAPNELTQSGSKQFSSNRFEPLKPLKPTQTNSNRSNRLKPTQTAQTAQTLQ